MNGSSRLREIAANLPRVCLLAAEIVAVVLAALVTAVAIGIGALSLKRTTTYQVVASTEAISMRLDGGVPWRWRLDRDLVEHLAPAAVAAERASKGRDAMASTPWTLQLGPEVNVAIERISKGPATIRVEQPSTCQPGALYNMDDEPVAALPCAFTVQIRDVQGRASMGQTTSLELQGQITLGTPMTFQGLGRSGGVLRSGRVRLRELSLLNERPYDADTLDLGAGDFLEVEGAGDGSGHGFVLIDERPGLTAAFTTTGAKAYVQRPGGITTVVESGVLDRLAGDEDFTDLVVLLGASGTAIGCAAAVESLRGSSGKRKKRKKKAEKPKSLAEESSVTR